MREGMAEYLQPFSVARIHAVAHEPVLCCAFIIKLRRTPQPAPDAAAGTFFQQDVVAVHQQQERGVSFWHGFARARCGELMHAIGLMSNATVLRRTLAAFWLAACADGRAQVHQRLGVGGDIALRQQRLALLPESPFYFVVARSAFDS